MIPFVNLRPAIDSTEPLWRAYLDQLFRRMQFILGEQLTSFESEFAGYLGSGHVVGVGSGTAAIELCLRDMRASGEVIAPALTAPFTGVAIAAAGCQPKFADINPDTLQMDAEDAGNRLMRRTAAIVPVHLYGQPCEIDAIGTLGKPVVQDAAQAHGARYKGRPLTAFSSYVAYSFYPTKNLGALGDGGAIATGNARVGARLRMSRDGGRRGGLQISELAGINSRLDEIQCCFLRAFLTRLDEWNANRARIAARYDQALFDCPGVRLLKRTAESVNHLYVIRAAKRDRLREFLTREGVSSAIHYPVPLHLHPAFATAGQKRGDLPVAEKACREIVSLPLWPSMPEDSIDRVAAAVRKFYRGSATTRLTSP